MKKLMLIVGLFSLLFMVGCSSDEPANDEAVATPAAVNDLTPPADYGDEPLQEIQDETSDLTNGHSFSSEETENYWRGALAVYSAVFGEEPNVIWDWEDAYVLAEITPNDDTWVTFIIYPTDGLAFMYANSRALDYIWLLDDAVRYRDLSNDDGIQGMFFIDEDGGFFGYLQYRSFVIDVGSNQAQAQNAMASFASLAELIAGVELDFD